MSLIKIKDTHFRETDTVLVLLSSYNGERFIKEQLNSLLNQTMNTFILIRDDGSTDNTVSIIREYIKKYNNIRLIEGNNIGYIASFNNLICNNLVDEYEWLAFCDQDDVWLDRKLEVAVSRLKKEFDDETPNLYTSALTLVDENLKVIGKAEKTPERNLRPALLYDIAGCTCVFNHATAVMYRKGINDSMIAHDRQLYCVCYYMGNVYVDTNSYILYRQHSTNTTGYAPMKSYIRGLTDILKDIKYKRESKWIKHFDQFRILYKNYLSIREYKQITRFTKIGESVSSRIITAIDPSLRADNIKQTIAFKTRVLVNRMY